MIDLLHMRDTTPIFHFGNVQIGIGDRSGDFHLGPQA
jgi:hypothetical protein